MDKNVPPSPAMTTKLLRSNGYLERYEELMKNFPLLIAYPYLANQEAGRKLMLKYQRPEELIKAFHKIYARNYTGDEILDLIAFYKTPVGQKLVSVDEKVRVELQEAASRLAVDIALQMVKDNQNNPPPKPETEPDDGFTF